MDTETKHDGALIFRLIPAVMSEIGAVAKTRKNEQQKYSFRGIEDMYQAVHPALVRHGVFCVPHVIDHKAEVFEKPGYEGKTTVWRHVTIKVCHRFYAPDGSYIEVVTCGEGLDNSDKATNKATSGAMKYALIELFSVPTQDIDDSDRTTPEAGKGTERTTAPIKIGRHVNKGGGEAENVKGNSTPATPKPPETPATISAEIVRELEKDGYAMPSREPGSDDDADEPITLDQQRQLHIEFRAAWTGDKKAAEKALQDWLRTEGFIGPDGGGTTKTIPSYMYADVRTRALKRANFGVGA